MRHWMMMAAVAAALMCGATGASRAQAQESKPQAAAQRVGVVDLDAVAKAVGRDVTIRKQLEDATKQVDEKLLAAANKMQEQVDAEKKKLGDKPSEEDQRRLQLMVAQGRQNVQNNKAAARVRLQQYRNELIIQFRTEVRPVVQTAAKQAGATVVLLANESVLWFDPVVDITDEVIAAYRANPPKATTPPAVPTPDAEEDDKPTLDQ